MRAEEKHLASLLEGALEAIHHKSYRLLGRIVRCVCRSTTTLEWPPELLARIKELEACGMDTEKTERAVKSLLDILNSQA